MQDTQLLLVVKNKPTTDESHPWEQARIITQLQCASAKIEGDAIVSDKCLVYAFALVEAFSDADKRILTTLEPGQWVEMTGQNDGPLADNFFPATIKVRDDLPKVVSDLPKPEDLHSVIDVVFKGKIRPEPVKFPARRL